VDTDVLVVGAGPVGLLLAAELELTGARAMPREACSRTGQLPIAKPAERRIADPVPHLWDLAIATGRTTRYDPGLVEFVESHYRARLDDEPREGAPIAEILPVPPGTSAADRLATHLGRTVEVAS
jgi:NADPH-dependent 2,4-dienoyl-CoA reductase/sulfur reductase-like enzyme